MSEESMMNDAALKREYAVQCILSPEKDPEKIREGMKLLAEACREKDPEATFLFGKLMLDGLIKPKSGEPAEEARKLLFSAQQFGSLQARVLLAELCEEEYKSRFAKPAEEREEPHPLTDFDGCEFTIQRKGLFTPVDAVLEFVDGKNILTLSLNLKFRNDDMVEDSARFREAVIKGMKDWEGEYLVFGDQPLTVKVDVTSKKQLMDNVGILLVTDGIIQTLNDMAAMAARVGSGGAAKMAGRLSDERYSLTDVGKEWSVTSRKNIFITCYENDDMSFEEISDITRHEFGHVLGLGDLYRDYNTGLKGVAKGSYFELDSYYISDEIYDLVMCDRRGVISNNDIEMVVLAFSDNCMQHYQPGAAENEVSEALGKGN